MAIVLRDACLHGANKKRGRRSRKPSPAPPVQPALRGDHVALTLLPAARDTSPRNTVPERMQGSGWMLGSVKAVSGAALSLAGRFAVMSGLSAGKGRAGLLNTYKCVWSCRAVWVNPSAKSGGYLLPPLHAVGEGLGWGEQSRDAAQRCDKLGQSHPNPPLPAGKGASVRAARNLFLSRLTILLSLPGHLLPATHLSTFTPLSPRMTGLF